MFRDSQPRQELIDKENEKNEWVWSNKRFCSVKGILSGFLFGCFSLALLSIIIGVIAPKSPESANIKVPDASEFTDTATHKSSNSEHLNKFIYTSSSITLPNTSRNLSRDSSLERTSKLNSQMDSPNFSTILEINQKMQDGPFQPTISNENKDVSIKLLDWFAVVINCF